MARAKAQTMATEVKTLDNGLKYHTPVEKKPAENGALDQVIAATESKEDKEAKALQEASKDKVLASAEAAAARLNKPNRKTLADWLTVGEAMVRIEAIANNNKKLIGKIIATLPEFSLIPSPIRSNAKWAFQNKAAIELRMKEGTLKGDHPTTIREQFRKEASQVVATDEPEDNDDSNDDSSNDDSNEIEETLQRVKEFLRDGDMSDIASAFTRLASELAEKPNTRKMLVKVLPKKK